MFFFALLLLIALNVFAVVIEDSVFLEATKPLFIPVFLIFYFLRNKIPSLLFVLFLISSFLGDLAFSFITINDIEKVSNFMYFISYLCLIGIIISKFRLAKIDKIIGAYLLLIFLINSYFLYTIYSILKTIISDSSEVLVFGLKCTTLIILLFVSFIVYLTRESKLSILFLMLGLCLFFSDVLNYINIYYIYDWRFVMLDRVLHAVALFFIFNYMSESSQIVKKVVLKEKIKEEVMSSENILA